jgi:hypothetical protein
MPKKRLSNLHKLVSDTRTGRAEAPQSEINAAIPEPRQPGDKQPGDGNTPKDAQA